MNYKLLSLLLFCALSTFAQRHIFTPLSVSDTLPESQWKGRWIGIDHILPGESIDFKTRVNARYLRTEFSLNAKPVRNAKENIEICKLLKNNVLEIVAF